MNESHLESTPEIKITCGPIFDFTLRTLEKFPWKHIGMEEILEPNRSSGFHEGMKDTESISKQNQDSCGEWSQGYLDYSSHSDESTFQKSQLSNYSSDAENFQTISGNHSASLGPLVLLRTELLLSRIQLCRFPGNFYGLPDCLESHNTKLIGTKTKKKTLDFQRRSNFVKFVISFLMYRKDNNLAGAMTLVLSCANLEGNFYAMERFFY